MKGISDDSYEIIDENREYNTVILYVEIKNHDREIVKYILNIEQEGKANALAEDNRISAYYIPELAKYLKRLCYDFPLWTGTMQSIINSPFKIATRAPVENSFNELKNQILRFDRCPMSTDRFIIKHIKSIDSDMIIFQNTQQKTQPLSKNDMNLFSNSSSNEECFLMSDNKNIITSLNNYENVLKQTVNKDNINSTTLQNDGNEDNINNMQSDSDENIINNIVMQSDGNNDASTDDEFDTDNDVESWRGKGK